MGNVETCLANKWSCYFLLYILFGSDKMHESYNLTHACRFILSEHSL